MIRFLYGAGMQVGLRHLDSGALAWLAGVFCSGDVAGHARNRELCERTGRRRALGRPCLSAAALPALPERIGNELPSARDVLDPTAAPAVRASDLPDTTLACPLEDLGPVPLNLVGDGDWWATATTAASGRQ